jgi:hypothetical protein
LLLSQSPKTQRDNVNSTSFVPYDVALAIKVCGNRRLNKQIFLTGGALSGSRKIYVFRYGTTALYALTSDGAGRNLPPQADPAGWRLEESVTLRRDKNSPKYELINATLAAIKKHGFILTHAAIHPLAGLIAIDVRRKTSEASEQSASSRL